MRDLRDPQAIGLYLKRRKCDLPRVSASGIADQIDGEIDFPLVPEADGVYVGPLERYGDPRARHEAMS